MVLPSHSSSNSNSTVVVLEASRCWPPPPPPLALARAVELLRRNSVFISKFDLHSEILDWAGLRLFCSALFMMYRMKEQCCGSPFSILIFFQSKQIVSDYPLSLCLDSPASRLVRTNCLVKNYFCKTTIYSMRSRLC